LVCLNAECKWATTDDGKEVLRQLRTNVADFRELDLVGTWYGMCIFRSPYLHTNVLSVYAGIDG
jgi:hypothetical protein